MRNLILTAVLIATTVFFSICPCMTSALASTPDPSVLLLAQIQPAPTPSPSPDPTPSPSPSLDTPPPPSAPSVKPPQSVKLAIPQTPAQNVNWSNLVLLVTAIVSSSLLMAMVLWVSLGQSKPTGKGSSTDQGEIPNPPHVDGLKEKGDFILKSFPTVIEGITVYLIVAVVAVLSLSATIQPEGTISIISGISGYVLGRQSSTKG